MTWVVWHDSHYGDLSYTECDDWDDAFDVARSHDDSDCGSLVCIERPDGSVVSDGEYSALLKAYYTQRVENHRADPPKPPIATLTIKAPNGRECVERLYATFCPVEDTWAYKRFGADRVTLTVHPPTTLVWRGAYRRIARTDFQQKKINESREHFGKPILKADTAYEDSFEYERVWMEGEVSAAQIASRTNHADVEVRGTFREAVEKLLIETVKTWKAVTA
ncbi:hypothetical protein [Mycobacterium sp. CnD-18-1]|uniref:hypothetical protein n=1 Tax=Mycobacterium sp. CnD-18-1 TaxID=2917744 RepID=UPI001EF1F44B|nr:hypothetical protein [Mycobacterium sp. CnD-18-1]MCG7607103.1 hypothetical protein [Mycobacterium sp. CnD-18-1]